MTKLSPVGWVALLLIVVGGLNWGLVGVFDFNLVTAIFGEATVGEASVGDVSTEGVSTGEPSALSKIVYIVVGLAALYIIAMAIICCKGKPCATSAAASESSTATESPALSEAESAGQGEGTTD